MITKYLALILLLSSNAVFADCWWCYDFYNVEVVTNNNKVQVGALALTYMQKDDYMKVETNTLSPSAFVKSMPRDKIILHTNLLLRSRHELGLDMIGYAQYILIDKREDIIISADDVKSIKLISKQDLPTVGIEAKEVVYQSDAHPFIRGSKVQQHEVIYSDTDYTAFYFLNYGPSVPNLIKYVMDILGAQDKSSLLGKFTPQNNENTKGILLNHDIVDIIVSGD